jgi:hypothetical protein
MAKGIESNVSDDESDTTSLDDLVELVHEQKGMLTKSAIDTKYAVTLARNTRDSLVYCEACQPI